MPDSRMSVAARRPVRTLWFLCWLYGMAVVWGVRSLWGATPSALDLLVPLYSWCCVGYWAIADARRRGRPIPLLSEGWFLLAPPIAVPGYMVLCRGWRGAGWLVLNAMLWFILATVALLFAAAIAYGGG
jgi:hypothetical protein